MALPSATLQNYCIAGQASMDIKPIRTKADYRAALQEIEALMSAQAGTPEGERLNMLATLVEAYERKLMEPTESAEKPGSEPQNR